MATTAPTQMQLAESSGQSAWNHAVKTFGDMGQQAAGANGAIAVRMTGGKSRKHRQSRKQSKKQSKRHRQSKKQRGGRR